MAHNRQELREIKLWVNDKVADIGIGLAVGEDDRKRDTSFGLHHLYFLLSPARSHQKVVVRHLLERSRFERAKEEEKQKRKKKGPVDRPESARFKLPDLVRFFLTRVWSDPFKIGPGSVRA